MGQGGAQVEAGTCRITKGWVVSLHQASCVSLLAVTEVRILFSHRDWETGPVLPDDDTAKEWLPDP